MLGETTSLRRGTGGFDGSSTCAPALATTTAVAADNDDANVCNGIGDRQKDNAADCAPAVATPAVAATDTDTGDVNVGADRSGGGQEDDDTSARTNSV